MQYREMGKTGDKVSALGYGCMRLPDDLGEATRQVHMSIEMGVNYFDTAYLYSGNEAVVGKILEGHRDKVLIATKMPPVQIGSRHDMDKMLDTQLARLNTDYIDYYLMHMLLTFDGWERMKRLGVEDFYEKAIASGKIRHAAFSYHGAKPDFVKIIDDYDWAMCQLQYNYVDEHNQAGREGLQYAANKGVGISIMEPLRGGHLVRNLPDAAVQQLKAGHPDWTTAEWALRWLWDQPEIATVLSGMNETAQIEENVRIATECEAGSMTDAERAVISDVVESIKATMKVPCTGCGYCMPCPAGVNIPLCFATLNDQYIHSNHKKRARFQYLSRTIGFDGGKRSHASLCKRCGICETKCPQHIEIRDGLDAAAGELEPFYFRPLVGLLGAYIKARDKIKGRK